MKTGTDTMSLGNEGASSLAKNNSDSFGKGIRPAFPLFNQGLLDPPAYLDSAASSQKPNRVIERFRRYLAYEHANIHRGAYRLSADATESYERAREKVSNFLGADQPEEVIFTSGATGSINLVAHGLERLFQPGDSILLTLLEHHSNIVPWQMLASRRGLSVHFSNIFQNAVFDFDDWKTKLKQLRPRLVSFTGLSNAFGTLLPIREMIAAAHAESAWVLIDAAQLVAHQALSVSSLDVDFLVFSAHKMYGPTGIGALYGRKSLLDAMDPFLGGGDMIERVTTEGTTFAVVPRKFEAGTPPIAEAIAFGEAVDFFSELGVEKVRQHEQRIFDYLFDCFSREAGVKLHAPRLAGKDQESILAFTIDGVHPHDFATVADSVNVQVRAGHHCAMPAQRHLGLQSTIRISLAVHSDTDDVDAALEAVRKARKMFCP
jgi:cysteine desulfurase/selenocysteine lyase